ncbi:MAG: hypothetical protein M1825_005550 [Sarcosagium campestre]|nr:MAG: hypothetical protein M1825_005550 [Sarcosagium campestre]
MGQGFTTKAIQHQIYKLRALCPNDDDGIVEATAKPGRTAQSKSAHSHKAADNDDDESNDDDGADEDSKEEVPRTPSRSSGWSAINSRPKAKVSIVSSPASVSASRSFTGTDAGASPVQATDTRPTPRRRDAGIVGRGVQPGESTVPLSAASSLTPRGRKRLAPGRRTKTVVREDTPSSDDTIIATSSSSERSEDGNDDDVDDDAESSGNEAKRVCLADGDGEEKEKKEELSEAGCELTVAEIAELGDIARRANERLGDDMGENELRINCC